MYDLSKVLEIKEISKKQVIIKVNAKDPLTVARYPFLNSEMAYITVTRGDEHVFTVTKENGKTWSFHFGKSGYTLIDESTETLKRNVMQFIKDNDIAIKYSEGTPTKATVYYNSNLRKWQLSVDTTTGCFIHWSDTAKNLDEALESFKGFVTSPNWNERKAVTGITIWDATEPNFTLK